LDKGNWSLDDDLIKNFPHKVKYLFKIWYNPNKKFKIRPSGEYPTTSLRTPYQNIVAMLSKLYGEHDASKFTLSSMPLIH
jgi:hypothetical protein